MPLVLDHVRMGDFDPPPWSDFTPAYLAEMVAAARRAVVVEVSNCTEYFYAGTDQEHWDHRADFPCVAPPWPTFWLDSRAPSRVVSRERGITLPNPDSPTAWGLLCQSIPLDRLESHVSMRDQKLHGNRERRLDWLRENRVAWGMSIDLWLMFGQRRPVGPNVSWILAVDEDGRSVVEPYGGTQRYEGLPDHVYPVAELSRLVTSLSGMLHAGLFAISLMHCKNVAQEERGPGDARPVRRAWERQHREPLTRYRVLAIEPFRATLARETGYGAPNGPTLGRALHIVRGHFAIYTEAAPLFGRLAGRFFRPMHARGTTDAGRVDKAYTVDPTTTGRRGRRRSTVNS